jgi:transcriptional regulator with XRE-family HTH domain
VYPVRLNGRAQPVYRVRLNGALSPCRGAGLADKVNWLISTAHPAGRDPYSNAEVAALIRKTTGQRVSHNTIWKLRNGQAASPQKRLIEAMARTFGVRPSFAYRQRPTYSGSYACSHASIRRLLWLLRRSRRSSAGIGWDCTG